MVENANQAYNLVDKTFSLILATGMNDTYKLGDASVVLKEHVQILRQIDDYITKPTFTLVNGTTLSDNCLMIGMILLAHQRELALEAFSLSFAILNVIDENVIDKSEQDKYLCEHFFCMIERCCEVREIGKDEALIDSIFSMALRCNIAKTPSIKDWVRNWHLSKRCEFQQNGYSILKENRMKG